MVRVRLDGTLKAAAIILAGSLSLAALAHAWAATTRTTATGSGWTMRENLLTGEARLCAPATAGDRAGCLPVWDAGRPAFDGGRPVETYVRPDDGSAGPGA